MVQITGLWEALLTMSAGGLRCGAADTRARMPHNTALSCKGRGRSAVADLVSFSALLGVR